MHAAPRTAARIGAGTLGGAVAGLVLGVLVLGPGMGRGFLLSYDMVFVPREPFRAALPGLAPPRAVPSDLVVAVLERVLPGDVAQKLVLLAIFTLASAGVAALLDGEPLAARLAGGVFYVWNPYVAERLIIGQWATLLGYAGLPWVLRALTRKDLASWRGAGRLALATLPAAAGGFAAMAITALLAVPVAVFRRDLRAAAVTLAVLAAGCLPWLVPSVLHPVFADPAGVAAFAARADTPFGSVGSLLMLGGMWNAQAVPRGYGGYWSMIWLAVVLAALGGYAFLSRTGGRDPAAGGPAPGPRWAGLGVAAVAGLLIACTGVTGTGRHLLRHAIGGWPGLAVLRDAQQYTAPLALAAACGAGLLTGWAIRPAGREARPAGRASRPKTGQRGDPVAAIYATAALLAPVLLLPGLAWGAGDRLRPAGYPAGWLAAARLIDASPVAGDVLLLPWASYRTPDWNHGETVLDPWPRLIGRPVIWNDGTTVGSVVLAPDDPRARALDPVIRGTGPLTATLRAHGVRFVVVDAGPSQAARLPGASVLVGEPGGEPGLVVYELSDTVR